MRVLVAGWTGSTNLGDELVFAGIRRLLGPEPSICAVSVAPEQTRRDHGVAPIHHRRVERIAAAARQADLVILGGGGLVQDETSPFNLPYHLSRPLLAQLSHTPWVGLALGAGPLHTAAGRALARGLRGAVGVSVRDEASAALLSQLGVPATLAADAAFHLDAPAPAPEGEDGDVLAVSLRPWGGGGGLLPVGMRRRRSPEPEWFVPTAAAALDRAVQRTGLVVRFVALQTDRDHELHERVAAAMEHDATTVVPTRSSVLDELARSRLVVAMRYHAGIGATLAGLPSVLIGYSPKVDALAATLGDGAARLAFDRTAIGSLDDAVVEMLARPGAAERVVQARALLRDRARANAALLAQVGVGPV